MHCANSSGLEVVTPNSPYLIYYSCFRLKLTTNCIISWWCDGWLPLGNDTTTVGGCVSDEWIFKRRTLKNVHHIWHQCDELGHLRRLGHGLERERSVLVWTNCLGHHGDLLTNESPDERTLSWKLATPDISHDDDVSRFRDSKMVQLKS